MSVCIAMLAGGRAYGQTNPVAYEVPELVFVGVGTQDTEFISPELVFVGVGAQGTEFTSPELVFVGVGSQDVEYDVPELVFVGVGSQDIEYDVPELVFVGVGSQDVEYDVPELVFVGVGSQDVEYDVPELVFVGVGSQDVEYDVPELVFVGVGSQDVEYDVPELVFVGVGSLDVEYDVPGLVFVGVGSQDIEYDVPELVFVGVGGEEDPDEEPDATAEAMRFEPGTGGSNGYSTDRKIEIRHRSGSSAAPNLRRLTARVFLSGDYQATRRDGHEIVLSLKEGRYDPRETVFRRIPDISGDEASPVDIDFSLRGTRTIAPGQWPEQTESNERTWYRFVSIDGRLETGGGQLIDQIGTYCYDAAEMRFVGMGQCQSQPAQD